jgi:hypothetical protein
MDDPSQIGLARFRAMLDAYGANSDRWPPEERDAGRALLAQSPQAQRWRDASAQLDALLDLAPADAGSPALIERILAVAPERGSAEIATPSTPVPRIAPSRPSRRATWRSHAWRYAGAALPLAAAAALVLWLLAKPSRTPEPADVTIAELGMYDAPTDALLAAPGVEALDSVPSFGCTGAGLGCLDVEPLNNQSALDWETYV